MVSPDLLAHRSRSGRRALAVVLALLAVGVPFALIFSTLWSTTGDTLAFTQAERDGVSYLGPLVRLLDATADAQTAAVAGRSVDQTALAGAVADVNDVDSRLGASLQTSRRWNDISTRLSALRGSAPKGAQAYAGYSQATDLELALVAAVGDSSNLILDPSLDSYYLMDTTLLRIPDSVVKAGRMVDLATVSSANAVRIETMRAQVGADASAIDTGLRKSLSTTRSASLAPQLLPSLDRLREALTAMAPPVDDVAHGAATRSAQQDAAARGQIRTAALSMESAGLSQLDQLLAARADATSAQRRLALAATILGAVVLLGLWWLVSRRRVRAAGHGELPAQAGADGVFGAPLAPAQTGPGGLVEARDLANGPGLVKAGRDGSPRRGWR